MKEFYICDCTRHENKIITSNFVVVSKQIKPKKTGEPYLALTLGDRSGHLEAKMWDNVEEVLNGFEQDDFLKVKGLVNKYKNRFQLTIHKLRKLGEAKSSSPTIFPRPPRTSMNCGRLSDFVASFRSRTSRPWCRLSWQTLKSPRRTATRPPPRLYITPTSAACWITWFRFFASCDLVCRNYPQINRDLLLTGAFFHDHRQDSRTHLQSFVLLHHARAVARAHDYRTGNAAGEACARSPISSRTQDSDGASDHQPSRRV